MCHIHLFACLLCCFVVIFANAQLESPCPEVFQYQMNGNTLYGWLRIRSPSPDTSAIQLNVELSVGNSVNGYNGNIELAYSKEQTVQDIMNNRLINYKVNFPVWSNIPPKITKIVVNGNLVCSGPKIAINLVPVLTTINLQHTVRVNVTPLSSSIPSDNSVPPNNRLEDFPFVVKYKRKQPTYQYYYTSRFDNRPGGGGFQQFSDPAFHDFDFSSNPPIQNNINFKPQPPKEPNNIFSGNPFITIVSDKPTTEAPIQNNNKPTLSGNPFFSPTLNDRQKPVTPAAPELPVRDSSEQSIEEVCGRPIVTNSLIVGGQEVPKGAYPWLTAIFRVLDASLTYICSGSLVSHKHVVTAAHCVLKDSRKVKPSDLLIILGKLNIARWTPTPGQEMVEPEKIHVHPDYNPSTSDADIAVIELIDSVKFSRVIKPICLWKGPVTLDQVVGQQGVVAGWGKNEEGLISTPVPKQTSLPIVDQLTCLRSSEHFHYITSNRTLCAGFKNGTGPCNGDSGSGLILKKGGVWMLRGIVSMSIWDNKVRSCDLHNYIVFTDASKFLTWLNSFISN